MEFYQDSKLISTIQSELSERKQLMLGTSGQWSDKTRKVQYLYLYERLGNYYGANITANKQFNTSISFNLYLQADQLNC